MAGNNNPDLQELKRLHAAATKGVRKVSLVGYIDAHRGKKIKQVARYEKRADAKWSIAIHNAFPAILPRLERAEAERDELEEAFANAEGITPDGELGPTKHNMAAWLAARDAQQRREGAIEAFNEMRLQAEEVGQQSGLAKKMCKIFADECIEQAAKRLREVE